MCEFFSCLVMRDGSIRWHWNSDSHSELIEHFGLRDDKPFLQAFAKAELTPDWSSDALLDAAQWTWRLDEPTRPDWLTNEIEAKAQSAARRVAASFILTAGEKRSLLDGTWILGGDARVIGIRGGRIIAMRGNAQVSEVWGNAQVSNVRGNAQVSDVGGNAQVSDVGGNAQVSDVWGNAILDDSAKAHIVKAASS